MVIIKNLKRNSPGASGEFLFMSYSFKQKIHYKIVTLKSNHLKCSLFFGAMPKSK